MEDDANWMDAWDGIGLPDLDEDAGIGGRPIGPVSDDPYALYKTFDDLAYTLSAHDFVEAVRAGHPALLTATGHRLVQALVRILVGSEQAAVAESPQLMADLLASVSVEGEGPAIREVLASGFDSATTLALVQQLLAYGALPALDDLQYALAHEKDFPGTDLTLFAQLAPLFLAEDLTVPVICFRCPAGAGRVSTLALAVRWRLHSQVRWMLERGAGEAAVGGVAPPADSIGSTLLHYLVADDLQMAVILMPLPVDPSTRNANGATAFHAWAEQDPFGQNPVDRTEVLKVLLEMGHRAGRRPLDLAAGEYGVSPMDLLVQRRPPPFDDALEVADFVADDDSDGDDDGGAGQATDPATIQRREWVTQACLLADAGAVVDASMLGPVPEGDPLAVFRRRMQEKHLRPARWAFLSAVMRAPRLHRRKAVAAPRQPKRTRK